MQPMPADIKVNESLQNYAIRKAREVAALEQENKQLIDNCDHWESKATELANDVATFFNTNIGEHSNVNCPVENAIDAVHMRMGQKPETIKYQCSKCTEQYDVDVFAHKSPNIGIECQCGASMVPIN
ncbi:hypothetical protein N473_07775 [Pseudoalteromonas luteoviolacea CPMOR-1]|uniref:Uncharacterized protein n=1 Tax=Pseudoalteromonas luteoviolacea CPMOR-1 TaxID=1365248 RepID=A0A162CI17_9GAMM|nr:hypothetical protein [Pseudoalteromonas luteoviolacea]KZN68314.1 hypothetical protein N473_07775 [Pseudoalteromonas luteoviolacea CPMOR-1]